jgi:hypothetical protein
MIVGSLLLILVAVTLLVMGLAAGSSVLLISSIAASLLAAVALVVGARQAAAARVAPAGSARSPLAVDLDDDPGPGTAAFDPAYDDPAAGPRSDAAQGGEFFGAERPRDWASVDVADPDRPAGLTDPEMLQDGQVAAAGESNPAETTQADLTYDGPAYPRESGDDFVARSDRDAAEPHGSQAGPPEPDRPDFQQAEGADPDAEAPGYGEFPDPAQAARDDVLAQLAADDTDEDPADEPPPQRVQPADAVQVSRMNADVLVVDGRPRYHVADCSHLYERDSEPLPVAEAVDLGFTPCGRCRPVDRLLAAAAHR